MAAPPPRRRSATSTRATTTTRPPTYDAKWGIDFGDDRPRSRSLGKLRKVLGARAAGPFGDALEIGAGHRLLLAEPAARRRRRASATCTDISPGHARRRSRTTPSASGSTSRRAACDAERAAVRGRVVRPRARPRRPAPPARPRRRRSREFHRVLRPGGRVVFAGEPSRVGDRIAAVPQARGASRAAPLWRRADARRARPSTRATHGDADDHALEAIVDVHAFVPDDLARASPRAPGFDDVQRPRRGAAGQLVRLGQPHARGDRRARTTVPWRGASTPTAATSRCRRSTARCSSRGCRRRSSTT